MPAYNSNGRDPRRNYNERPANRNGSRLQGSRTQGNRSQQGRRRKKRTQPRFYLIIAVLFIILIAALVVVVGSGKGGSKTVQPMATPVPSNNNGMSNVTISSAQPVEADNEAQASTAAQAISYSTLADLLEDEDSDLSGLAAEQLVQVNGDYSINPNLPADWINILLLGTDERTLSESARTDAMIICSINPGTGEVKLSSIMRDTAVKFDDLGDLNGTYRINSANYFGGPEYAMKTVNECFDMNIQYYVTVNFFGFQKIAQALGGIEANITEAEMKEINKRAVEQAKVAYREGIDESDQINEYLETYGENTHLNGRQTLAYARIRSTDSDFSRAQRQRYVLEQLMKKLKGKSAAEIMAMAVSLSGNVQTNMDLNKIIEIAVGVLNSGFGGIEGMRLPVPDSYVQERRNEKEMFYDTDWAHNARELYNFIYA